MRERLQHIDQMKGLAIILVVMGHVTRHCILGLDNWIYAFIYSFHMPLFFFVSGLVCRPLAGGLTAYVGRKAQQLLLPFAVWGAAAAVYLDHTYGEFLQDYFKLGYWYLSVLFLFCLVHAAKGWLLTRLGRSESLWADMVLAALCYVALRQLPAVLPPVGLQVAGYAQVVLYFPFFYLGTLALRCRGGVITKRLVTPGFLGTVLFLALWAQGLCPSVVAWMLPLSMVALLYGLYSGWRAGCLCGSTSGLAGFHRATHSHHLSAAFLPLQLCPLSAPDAAALCQRQPYPPALRHSLGVGGHDRGVPRGRVVYPAEPASGLRAAGQGLEEVRSGVAS